jgi:hypothetical protein
MKKAVMAARAFAGERPPPRIEKRMRQMLAESGVEELWPGYGDMARLCFDVVWPRRKGGPKRVGSSRFGGIPDLPRDCPWPELDGELMTFIAQINLADVSRVRSPLPRKGRLYFFVGEVHTLCTVTEVIYSDVHGARLTPTPPPPGKPYVDPYIMHGRKPTPFGKRFPGCFDPDPISLKPYFSLPPADEWYWPDDEFLERMFDLDSAALFSCSRLLGYPNHLLNTLNDGFERPLDQWRLLLQVDSVGQMLWADAGALCFFIKHGDLARGDFTRTHGCIKGAG